MRAWLEMIGNTRNSFKDAYRTWTGSVMNVMRAVNSVLVGNMM